jgi:hypothetical protein
MDAQMTQTIAAVIQAVAAVVFLLSVGYDAFERRRQRRYLTALHEQERRDQMVAALREATSPVRPP